MAGTNDRHPTPEPAEQVISRVLEPGEKILWSGRPHVEVSMDHFGQRRRRARTVGIPIIVIVTLWLARDQLGLASLEGVSSLFSENPRMLLAMMVLVVLIALVYVFKVDDRSRLERHIRSLSYAISDRRLLILERDKVVAAYTPEQTRRPSLHKRSPGYSDVIFDQRSSGEADEVTRDPVARERRQIGFKALPNAQEIKQHIEEWIDDHIRETAREVADFVKATPSRQRRDLPTGGRRIENLALGLKLDAPEEWKVRVRMKKKPQGKIFLDKENWHQESETGAWNLVKIEGPSRCMIEVEVFETMPTVTFDELAHSKLADSITGKIIESGTDCEINGMRGFYVTRRNDLQMNPDTNSVGIGAVVAPERHTVLHDGQRQIFIVSTWPEDSEDLKRAVEAVVESIELN